MYFEEIFKQGNEVKYTNHEKKHRTLSIPVDLDLYHVDIMWICILHVFSPLNQNMLLNSRIYFLFNKNLQQLNDIL